MTWSADNKNFFPGIKGKTALRDDSIFNFQDIRRTIPAYGNAGPADGAHTVVAWRSVSPRITSPPSI